MARSPMDDVVTHWSKKLDDYYTPTLEFYAAVESALRRRNVPGLYAYRIKWSEGGITAPDREYLRIKGEFFCIDLCAAPFGTGFFFSSWSTVRRPRHLILVGFGFFVATLFLCVVAQQVVDPIVGQLLANSVLAFVTPWISFMLDMALSVLALLALVRVATRAGKTELELNVLALPIVGSLYRQLFAPESFYRIDTLEMFHATVHTAMLEVIDGLLTTKGLRALSGDERKPIFTRLTA